MLAYAVLPNLYSSNCRRIEAINSRGALLPNLYRVEGRSSVRAGAASVVVATYDVSVAFRSACCFFNTFFSAIILSKAAFFLGCFV